MIGINSDNKDEEFRKDNFIHKFLLMIDNVIKEEIFNCTIDKGHCTKRSPLVPAIIGMQCLNLLVLD